MWLAEVLGRMKGVNVQFRNDSVTNWGCDPHTEVRRLIPFFLALTTGLLVIQVPFQPNNFDCGVYTLCI